MAIGARSQSAKTYLERHLDEFLEADLEALVAHGIRALRDTLPNEIELNNKVSNTNLELPLRQQLLIYMSHQAWMNIFFGLLCTS